MGTHYSKISVAVVVALVGAGCATPKFNYKPVTVEVSEPMLNEIVLRSVGEEMLKQGQLSLVDILRVTEPIKPALAITITPGIYRQIGSDNEAIYFDSRIGAEDAGAVKGWLGDFPGTLMLRKNTRELCAIGDDNSYRCAGGVSGGFSLEKITVVSESKIQQTLIYSGKVGSRIRLGYREFSNNLARPAFSNDVEYDLLESSIIGYKGAQIQVIEATNQHIKYKVVQNFNKAIGSSVPNQPTAPNDQKPATKTLKESRSDFFRFPVS